MAHLWGILGGGFGLYGYLPAISKRPNCKVMVLEKHLPFINSRPELKQYHSIIEYTKTNDDILSRAESLVLALSPKVQEELILARCLKDYKYLMLEKPVASTPKNAIRVLDKSRDIASAVRIGYSFSHTIWALKLQSENWLIEKKLCNLSWFFTAHHFQNNVISWKSEHELGGGILRFYGIQLIAFFSIMGNVYVESSRIFSDHSGNPFKWEAKLKIENGAAIALTLNSRSSYNLFSVDFEDSQINRAIDLVSPFSDEEIIDGDSRVLILDKIFTTFDYQNNKYYDLYKRVNHLWVEIENLTKWKISS